MFKDNVFKISRFMNLCRKNMVESWKTNLLRVSLMYGVMVVILLWTGYLRYDGMLPGADIHDSMVEVSFYLFIVFGIICGIISASFTMENMKSKTSRIAALMNPATPFEKYFSRWFVSTVVFMVVFIIAYMLADGTRVLVYSIAYPEKNIVMAKLSYFFATTGDYTFMENGSRAITSYFAPYLLVQSCFVLGSSVWPKNSLIKTFVAGFLIMLAYGFIFAGIGQLLFDTTSVSNSNMDSEGFEDTLKTIGYIVQTVFIFLNWTLAYFRFKESEIINRW